MTEKRTDAIETFTGKAFYPLEPDLELIDILDIAHGLSYQGRFTGQARTFFSIARHCINVAKEVKINTRTWDKESSLKAQRIALIHDASEAYISDINSPCKKHMPEYKKIEENLQNAIYKKFGITHDTHDKEYQIVDLVDKHMAGYEAMHLMPCKIWDIEYSYLVQRHIENDPLKHLCFEEELFSYTEKEYLKYFKQLFPNFEENNEEEEEDENDYCE